MKDWGLLVPLVTPCTPDGDIDVSGLQNVTMDMLNAGYSSIFVAGSTGRGPWLSRDQRTQLCKTVIAEAGGAVRVLGGCTGSGLPEMLENARWMADAGAQGAVITIPGYYKYNQDEVYRMMMEFADHSPIPVFIYDIPDFTHLTIDAQVILKCSQHGNIAGYKDSTNEFSRFSALLQALKDRDDFYILQGKERWLLESLKNGASGFVVSLIHIYPPLFMDLYQFARKGEWDKAAVLQAAIDELIDMVVKMFESRPETSTLFHFINQVLVKRGVCKNIVLGHEGECPDMIRKNAELALQICIQSTAKYISAT